MLDRTKKFVKTHKKETALAAYGAACMVAGVLLSRDHYMTQTKKQTDGIKRIAGWREMEAYQKGLSEGLELFKLTTHKK